MKEKELYQKFLNEHESEKELIGLVVTQLGVDTDDNDDLRDSLFLISDMRSGKDGYTGFIYYYEGHDFYGGNRDVINQALSNHASEFGYKGIVSFVQSWEDLSDWTEEEICKTVYSPVEQMIDYVAFDISVYCLEHVAHLLNDFLYENNYQK